MGKFPKFLTLVEDCLRNFGDDKEHLGEKMMKARTLVLFCAFILSSCSSNSRYDGSFNNSNEVDISEYVDELIASTTVAETTTTVENPAIRAQAIAYDACKLWRQTEFAMIDNWSAAYPYSDKAQHNLIAHDGALRAKDKMMQAATLDASYQVHVNSLDKWIPYLFRDVMDARAGREPSSSANDPSGSDFHALCTWFGLYPSSPGLYPPMNYVAKPPAPTPLNGARRVCHEVFFISPDKVVFYGNAAFTLDECDELALSIANNAASFNEAKEEMLNQVFAYYEKWCWYRDCKSRWDIS